MVKSDSESYVRASALKCLIKMVPINIIWENNLNNNELIVGRLQIQIIMYLK